MDNKDIQEKPELPDEDTKKILDDMGVNEDGSPKEEPKEEPDKKPEAEQEVVEPPKESEPSQPEPKIPTRSIPIPKYTDEKRKWREKEEELSTSLEAEKAEKEDLKRQLELSKTPQEFQVRIGKFADKHGLDKEAMTELGVEILNEATRGHKELEDRVNAQEQQTEDTRQDTSFEQEFKGYVESYPEMKEHTAKIKELALGDKWEDWAGKSVFEIFYRGVKPNLTEPKKGAEPSKGGTQRGKKIIDFDKAPTEEEIKGMTDKEFEKYSNLMAKKQGSGLSKSFER